ncbi:MAG: hypothetical protein IPG34_16510 [Rhodocyclaceae bacterium]|nr:hypothetical protein [Rhodocyclaceae bacterium]
MTVKTESSIASEQERNYRAVLIRNETKQQLRDFRSSLPDQDINQERRLATAAIELMLEEANGSTEVRALWRKRVNEVLLRELSEHDVSAVESSARS